MLMNEESLSVGDHKLTHKSCLMYMRERIQNVGYEVFVS